MDFRFASFHSSKHPNGPLPKMPDSRSRSRSPPSRRDRRPRSRSPYRRHDDDRTPRRSGGGGFKWKEKRRDGDERHGEGQRRLERGYRDTDRARRRSRDRERERPRSPYVNRERPRSTSPRGTKQVEMEVRNEERATEKPKKEKKEKKESAPAPTGEPMIIVNVNDRLGTKAAIPCLASDPISSFFAAAPWVSSLFRH